MNQNDIKILQAVINKWESFCFNFTTASDENGIRHPKFLEQIKWEGADAAHMIAKWHDTVTAHNCKDASAALHIFFGVLDSENQQSLINFAFGENQQ